MRALSLVLLRQIMGVMQSFGIAFDSTFVDGPMRSIGLLVVLALRAAWPPMTPMVGRSATWAVATCWASTWATPPVRPCARCFSYRRAMRRPRREREHWRGRSATLLTAQQTGNRVKSEGYVVHI
jgi:hypothetical protein